MNHNIAVIIDTDIIIDFFRNRPYAIELLTEHAEAGLLAISTLTQFEIYQGMRPAEETATGEFLEGLVSLDVTKSIARAAGKMLRGLRARGVTIGAVDGLIAATALELSVPLLTNNSDHYPFPNLKVIRGN